MRKDIVGNCCRLLLSVVGLTCTSASIVLIQAPTAVTKIERKAKTETEQGPAFEVATIKPLAPDAGGVLGFFVVSRG